MKMNTKFYLMFLSFSFVAQVTFADEHSEYQAKHYPCLQRIAELREAQKEVRYLNDQSSRACDEGRQGFNDLDCQKTHATVEKKLSKAENELKGALKKCKAVCTPAVLENIMESVTSERPSCD